MEQKFDRHIFYLNGRRQIEAASGGLDMLGADNVEVQVDHNRQTLWINANGSCKLRIYNIRGYFEFIDLRRKTDECELYERGLANLRRIEAERAADEMIERDLARIVRAQADRASER